MYGFTKKERLSSEKLIQTLFKQGDSFFLHPFRVFYYWELNEKPGLPQVLITVPKRNHKKAVSRNKIKRHIKETYRLNKSSLIIPLQQTHQLYIGLMYIGKELSDFNELNIKMPAILKKIPLPAQKK